MIKIGVLSDTHLTRVSEELRRTMEVLFRHADMVFHAGDMTSREVYDYLCNWNLVAVRGNMDDFDLRDLLPEKRTQEIGGKRIGIMHGRGGPETLPDLVWGEFDDVDLIIFGHSHVPLSTTRAGKALFNPGSFRPSRGYRGTVGLMEIDHDIRLNHVGVT